MYSKDFADNYDALMGSYASRFAVLDRLIAGSSIQKKKLRILELACGSGNNLLHLSRKHELHGLDISKDMISLAKKKVPHAHLVVGDMTNFSFAEKFDLILCLFDSINHLLNFNQWEKVFSLAQKHLKENGVFIFDMNTPKRLERLALRKTTAEHLGNSTIAIKKITQKNDHLVTLHVLLLRHINTPNISIAEQFVDESSFEIRKVEQALKKYFSIEKRLDPLRSRITKNSMRLYFVCRKRS